MNYFITAIGTDSGKTLVSAIICQAFGADYWKPIQAGLPRDAEVVKRLVSNDQTRIFEEAYLLKTPASPHAAAPLDGLSIDLDHIQIPSTNKPLIVEGAGGCLVPLNDSQFMIDLAHRFSCEIILVSDLYLGSINHTLLTVNLLKERKLTVKGIIFNGEPNTESERIILHHARFPCLLRIRQEKVISQETVSRYAAALSAHWKNKPDDDR